MIKNKISSLTANILIKTSYSDIQPLDGTNGLFAYGAKGKKNISSWAVSVNMVF